MLGFVLLNKILAFLKSAFVICNIGFVGLWVSLLVRQFVPAAQGNMGRCIFLLLGKVYFHELGNIILDVLLQLFKQYFQKY